MARLFTTYLVDGPFSEHYEPRESDAQHPARRRPTNPMIRWYDGVRETLANGRDEYPYVCTVYRVVEREHFVTSNVPYLVELMPDFFVEVPHGLAAEKGIENGERVRVWSKRGEVEGVAVVTKSDQAPHGERRDVLDRRRPRSLGLQGNHHRVRWPTTSRPLSATPTRAAPSSRPSREFGEGLMAPDEGMLAQGAQAPQGGLAIRRISATPGHSLERGPDGAPAPPNGPEYAKLIDISRWYGCKGCEVACKEWNELGVEPTENFGSMQSHRDLSPDTWLLMRFNEIEVEDDLQWLIKKDACLHCEEPGCLYACPAPGAIVQYENGIVDFNQEQCIGCQLCVSGCPFDIPRFNPDTRKVYKCNMCVDRVEAGLEPACVKTCPTNAISWGTKEDMLALAAKKGGRVTRERLRARYPLRPLRRGRHPHDVRGAARRPARRVRSTR